MNLSRLAFLSGVLFVGIVLAGALIDHAIEPSRGVQGALERSAILGAAVVVALWLSLHGEGVSLR